MSTQQPASAATRASTASAEPTASSRAGGSTGPTGSASASAPRPSRSRLGVSAGRGIMLVARREILAQVRSRATQVSFAIMLVLVAGGIVLMSLFQSGTLGGGGEKDAIAAVSSTAARVEASGHPVVQASSAQEAVQLVRDGTAKAALLPAADAASIGAFGGDGEPVAPSADPSSLVLVGDEELSTSLLQGFLTGPEGATLVKPETSPFLGYLLAIAFGVLFLGSAIGYTSMIAQSVVEEKATRIVEILLATVPARTVLAGKVLGNSVMALGQIAAIGAVGLLTFVATGQTMLFSLFGPGILWFIVFFAVGFVLLASLYAGVAAMVSRQEDIGSVTTPLMLLVMIPYFLVIFFNDDAGIMGVLSYVPFSAPIAMPVRAITGAADWWEPIVSLGVLAATAALAVWIGARLYEHSVLRMGGRVKLKEAWAG